MIYGRFSYSVRYAAGTFIVRILRVASRKLGGVTRLFRPAIHASLAGSAKRRFPMRRPSVGLRIV